MEYVDIGHNDPKDIIWIIRDGGLENVQRGGNWTHELLWGQDIVKHWRGRFEVSTGSCSIAPPDGARFRRPHSDLLETLMRHFPVYKFVYFADGVEEFFPNPKRG